MTSKRRPYKTYPREFKLEAVRMMDTSDRPASEIESELGIRRNLLYKWKEQIERKGEANLNSERGRPPDNLLGHIWIPQSRQAKLSPNQQNGHFSTDRLRDLQFKN